MKTSVYFRIICFGILIFANGCRHQKPAVPKQKGKKSPVTAKVSAIPANKNTTPVNSLGGGNSRIIEQKLGVTDNEIKNSKLFLFINDWYGVPYKYGGCQKSGVDCSCFTNLLYEKVYNKKTARSAGEMYDACEKIVLDEIREGDLIFFKIEGNLVSHVGVYLRNNLFVHSSTSKGVVINSVNEAYYKKYFHAGGRFKNS